MKIPKYIDTLLKRRTRLANKLIRASAELDEWLDKNGIEPDSLFCHTGVCIYTEPDGAERGVRSAIKEANEDE